MKKVVLGGIVKSSSGSYIFRIEGTEQFLQQLKKKLHIDFSKKGYEVDVERGYYDE